jgi:ATP-binding cassette subfamily C protein LapB
LGVVVSSPGAAGALPAPAIGRLLRAASAELVAASLLIGLLSLALPFALLHVYDRVLAQSGLSTFWMLALGVAVAIVLETALRIARGTLIARTGAVWEARAQQRAIDRLLHTPITRFEQSGHGAYLERLSSIATVRDAYSGAAFQTLLDLPFCLLYVAAMLHLSPVLAMVPLAGALLFLLATRAVARRVRRAVNSLSEGEERRYNMLFDLLSGIHTVKALGLERQMTRRYERLQLGCASARAQLAEASVPGQGLALLLANIAAAAVAALGTIEVLEGRLTVGGLGACLMLSGRAMQPLGGALGVFARAEVLRGARARLAEIEALPDARRPGAAPLAVTRGRIVFDRVVLRSPDGSPILDGVSLEVAPGSCIAIRGANGSGRSTVLQLILGQQQPESGRVLIDGQDLALVEPASIADGVGLLPARGMLIRGSLIENLTMHRAALAPRARAVAAELGLDALAATLPQGYDTSLADGTTMISGGMVQLISIARALVTQPRILLFDEANARLDAAADRALVTLLARLAGHCTIVLVSHRPSTLALAGRRFMLAGGRLEPLA